LLPFEVIVLEGGFVDAITDGQTEGKFGFRISFVSELKTEVNFYTGTDTSRDVWID
jgi:hypothetical protein